MANGPPLSELTAAQLRERAQDCRRLAATASTAAGRDALIRLADRFEALAATQEAVERR
jgi:hypothetical protein